MTKRTKTLGIVGAIVLTASALAAQSAIRLVVDGKVVSSNVVQENGHYLVPLDDVANYFGYTLNVTDGQATLTRRQSTPPTGTVGSGISGSGDGLVTPPLSGSTTMNQTSYLSTQTSAPVPPTQVTVNVGQDASVDGFDYAVTSIDDAGAKYSQHFDQRSQTVRSPYKEDTLAVVNIRETNRGQTPRSVVLPSPSDVTVFDGKQVGYRATYIDARQPVDLGSASNMGPDYSLLNNGMTSPTIMLGPGGSIQFAVIAGVPKGDPVNSVMISLPSSTTTNPGGAVVMVNR